jgi:hypothetical protein
MSEVGLHDVDSRSIRCKAAAGVLDRVGVRVESEKGSIRACAFEKGVAMAARADRAVDETAPWPGLE